MFVLFVAELNDSFNQQNTIESSIQQTEYDDDVQHSS